MIDLSMAVYTPGTDHSPYVNQKSPLFHVPLLGGWRDYTVYEAEQNHTPEQVCPQFYIGWIILDPKEWTTKEVAVQRLTIEGSRIRTLNGKLGHAAYFFAINSEGAQIPLRAVGNGRLGDNKYPGTRLF